MAVLGPSGCGKTTLLRLVAGFERPDAGAISVGGRELAGPETFVLPEKRRIGIVFQDYALFPHLTVEANVAFGLSRREREERERITLTHARARGAPAQGGQPSARALRRRAPAGGAGARPRARTRS